MLEQETSAMRPQATIGERILELVSANPDCTMEEVMQQLPELSWSDVFLEVERLARVGQLRLIQNSLLLAITLRLS